MISLCPWSWTSQHWRKVPAVVRGHQGRPHCLWCSKRSLSCDSLSLGSVTRPLFLSRIYLQSIFLLAKQHAIRRLKVLFFFSVVNPYIASFPSHPGCLGMKYTCHNRNKATSVLGIQLKLLSMVPRALFLWTLFIPSALLTCFFHSTTQCSSHMQPLPGPTHSRTFCLAVQMLFPLSLSLSFITFKVRVFMVTWLEQLGSAGAQSLLSLECTKATWWWWPGQRLESTFLGRDRSF